MNFLEDGLFDFFFILPFSNFMKLVENINIYFQFSSIKVS